MSIATIVNFCSIEYPFLEHVLRSVFPFSAQIIVPVCDHLFNGVPESLPRLCGIYAEHSEVTFVQFAFDVKNPRAHLPWFWHNMARFLGWKMLQPHIDFVLLLDCDEIVETDSFIQWVAQYLKDPLAAVKLANYWYFRSPSLRAKTWEDTAMFVQRDRVSPASFFLRKERLGMYYKAVGARRRMSTSQDGFPMIHHFSWVRTKSQMLQKVRSWGHRLDRNWEALVDREFATPFCGTDFVHGYQFEKVNPIISLSLEKQPTPHAVQEFPYVKQVSLEEVNRLEICASFNLE